MSDGERITINVTGGFLANRGPYDRSPLEVTLPEYSVSGEREVESLGKKYAKMPNGSLVVGDLYRTTHDHSLIFRPGDSRKK